MTRYLVYTKGNRYRLLRHFPDIGDMCRNYGETGEGSYDAEKCIRLWGLQHAVLTWSANGGQEQWLRHPVNVQDTVDKFVKSAERAGFTRAGVYNQ